MPIRKDRFVDNGIYHIFNKTIDNKDIFFEKKLALEFLKIVKYYRSSKVKIKYSHFKRLPDHLKTLIEREISKPNFFQINILSYCLMPNHFHLLVKQIDGESVSKFMANVLNSFTRFHNRLRERKGPLFLTQFKSQVIKSNEQLIHTSRYIHLNPFSSQLVQNISMLSNYPLSSYKTYIEDINNKLTNTKVVLGAFNNSRKRYKLFVENHAEHQRTLEIMKNIDKQL